MTITRPLHGAYTRPLHSRRQARGDPMLNDEYDDNDDLMRRTEHIETRDHGTLHARCVGDAEAPLLLYLHGHNEGSSSLDLNGLTVSTSDAFTAARKAAEAAARKAVAEAVAAGGAARPAPLEKQKTEFVLTTFDNEMAEEEAQEGALASNSNAAVS